MAITPPSDIVLDALEAGDRTRQAVLQREFNRIAAQPAGPKSPAAAAHFSRLIAARTAGLPFDAQAALVVQRNRQVLIHPTAAPAAPVSQAAQKFEAMMLQNFVGVMLPEADGTAFGKGTVASINRSWMAEAVADQLAAGGGIGIARQIDASLAGRTDAATAPAAAPSAPAGPGATTISGQPLQAATPLGKLLATLQAFLLDIFDGDRSHPGRSQAMRLSR